MSEERFSEDEVIILAGTLADQWMKRMCREEDYTEDQWDALRNATAEAIEGELRNWCGDCTTSPLAQELTWRCAEAFLLAGCEHKLEEARKKYGEPGRVQLDHAEKAEGARGSAAHGGGDAALAGN